jgi:hypothetical protein
MAGSTLILPLRFPFGSSDFFDRLGSSYLPTPKMDASRRTNCENPAPHRLF